MSLSDFSISSPRKAKPGDRSLTYDEDFENFLNDETSESEFSPSKFKKQQQQPWWMNEKDDKQASNSFASTKSFLKKTKPEIPKLKTTYETNEPEELIEDTARSQKSVSNNYSEDFDEENSKREQQESSKKTSEKDDSENEEQSTEQASFSPKLSPNKNDSQEIRDTSPKATLQGTTPNLLSKVMFVDSLESGALGAQTLKQLNDIKNSSELGQQSKMNTQIRQDFDELQAVYQNLATHTDSGVNTMNKTAALENSQPEEIDVRENYVLSENLNNSAYDSDFGLQAVNLVKEELEKRILDQVIEEIKTKPKISKLNTEPSWPPNKYRHVKSTGYGTTWKSKSTHKKNPINQSTFTLRPFKSNYDIDSFKDSDFDSHFAKNNETVKKLQDQLIKCSDDYELKIKELRQEYERQLKELRSRLLDVTNQLNEKFNENFKKRVTFEDNEQMDEENKQTIQEQNDKIVILEKSLKEQEELMKGYQIENERLYSEIKKTKQDAQKQLSQLEEEKKQLKLELIQERLQDNQKSIDVNKSMENASKVILPIKEETCLKDERDKKIASLNDEILELKKIVQFYEKNQQQIELDVKIVDDKNKQIKKLNEKIHKIELNKTSPDFVRENTRLKKQLQELDLVIKRMRQTKQTDPSPVNLSIDYYEKRIEDLEAKLKDKSIDMERLNRMWNQKMFVYKKLRDEESGVVSRDRDLSPLVKKMNNENQEKMKNLQLVNQNLKKSVDDLRGCIAEKNREIELLKSSNKNNYEPSEFVLKEDKVIERRELESMRQVYTEMESLKIKLCKKENELVLREKDFEYRIEQMKDLNSKKWDDLNKKHKAEIEKLVSAFTGSKVVLNGFDGESVFEDPIKFRLLIEACNRSKESQAKIGKLVQLNKQLSQKCVYFESLVQRLSNAGKENDSEIVQQSDEVAQVVAFYENQLRLKNNEIEKFRNELDTMLSILQSLNS